MKQWLLGVVISLVFVGCASDGGSEIEGYWYTLDFVDGDQCFAFCGDGRAFSGDSPCTETDRSDFDSSRPVSFTEDTFSLEFSDGSVTLGYELIDDQLFVSFEGQTYAYESVPSSGLCEDSSRE